MTDFARYLNTAFILRAGLAFALFYPAIDALFHPLAWIGYFPGFALGIVPDTVLLHTFGAVETALALWLLSGWKTCVPAAATLLLLIAIVMFNLSQLQVLFRDLAIAAMALALLVIPPRKRYSSPT